MASPKALIELLGDSITRGYGLTDIPTQSIKAAYDHYLQGLVDVGLHGYDGYQSSALGPRFTADVLPELDPTRLNNILVVLGGANDILGSTGDAPTIASRLQTVLNNAKSEALAAGVTLTAGITGLFSVSSTLGTWDESVKTSVNALITAGSFDADFKGDSEDDDILSSQTEMAKLANTVDGLHPTASSNLRRALYVDLPVIGPLNNLPLISVFDFPKAQYSSDEDIIPFNVPFGGNQSDTKVWEWKVVDGAVLSTAQNPNFGPFVPGSYDIQLSVTTTTNGTNTVTRSISVVAPNNIGTGAISPAFPTPTPSAVVPMTVSGVTSPKIFILSGGGSISGISGNDFNFNAPASGDTVIKAEEEMWASSDHAISQDDNSVTWNSADGYAASSVARFTAIGDGFEEVLTTAFLATAGNKLAIANTSSGTTFALIVVDTTHVKVNTTGGGDETTLTVAAGDKIALEIGPSNKILVKKNTTLVYTTTSSYDSLISFPMVVFFIMLATISIPRPRFYGSGVTLWNSGESDSVVTIVPSSVLITNPTPGAAVKGTITLSANAFDSDGITSVQFKVDGVNLGSPDTTEPYSAALDTTSISDGTHTLTAVMLNVDSATFTSPPVTFIVDNTAPTGEMTNPLNGGLVAGTIDLTTNASDTAGIAGIQYKVDGANFGVEVTVSPFTKSLDTLALSEGNHTAAAIIRDITGNSTTTSEVTFEVSNYGTGVLVSSGTFHSYEGADNELIMRIYVKRSFTSVDGIVIIGGQYIPMRVESVFYKQIGCSVSNGVITFSSFRLDSTSDALDNPKNTSYTLALYTTDGEFLSIVAKNIVVPPDSPTTLADIIGYSSAHKARR